MPGFSFLLPHLPSFSRKPSWVNRAGRVDRSACFELRASEVWRLLPNNAWRPMRNFRGREAVGRITIASHLLFLLHRKRSPRRLIGDLRTPKSNAMKGPYDPQRRRNLKKRDRPWRALRSLHDADYANPNKGATRSKMLALWSGAEPAYEKRGAWTQTITLERWRFRFPSPLGPAPLGRGDRSEGRPTPDQRSLRDAACRVPSRTQHFLVCPACGKKKLKLFMVLATEQEVNDAELAEGWIRMFDALGGTALRSVANAPHSHAVLLFRARLIDRYGLLFRSRRLICRECLGIRYGEVKRPPPHEPESKRPNEDPLSLAVDDREGLENVRRVHPLAHSMERRMWDLTNMKAAKAFRAVGIDPEPFLVPFPAEMFEDEEWE